MKKLTSVVVVTAIAGAVLLGNATSADAEKVTAQRVVDMVIGNTVFEKTARGIRNKVLLREDGGVAVDAENGFFDEGRWEITDGKLCLQFEEIQAGRQICFRDFDLEGNMFTAFSEARNERQPFRIHNGIASSFEDVIE